MNIHSIKYEHTRFMIIYVMFLVCFCFLGAVHMAFILGIPLSCLAYQLYLWSPRGKASVKEAVDDFIAVCATK